MRRAWMARIAAIVIAVGAFCSSGCGKILGLHEGVPSGECVLNSDCRPDKACIFTVCSSLCEADKDCPPSNRCLKTANGHACVDSLMSGCDRSCPGGSVCDEEQGVCRNACTASSDCSNGQTCTVGLCRGVDTSHDPRVSVSEAGTSVVGGDAGDQGSIGVPNAHCSPDNAYACVGHAQKGVLSCNPTTHVWTALPACAGQQLCDTTPGANQGSCQEPATGCFGKMPGDRFCTGTQSVTCGPDLLTSTTEACPILCFGDGQCGACVPMSQQCSGNGVQTCQMDGTWGTAAACPKACVGKGECGACMPMAKDCSNNGVETCQLDGTWGAPATCTNQACVNAACIGQCTPNAVKCNGSQPQTCDMNGVWKDNGAACSWPATWCSSGACIPPKSCAGLAAKCGSAGTANCCASNVVTGGTYNRSNNGSFPAKVSDFRLDNYEITVGRFRNFVAAYSRTMTPAGAGKNPSNPNDPGWNVGWNTNLWPDAAALKTAIKCEPTYQTWTDAPASNENRPMNCLSWYEAFAFCIWDGGRLPTEAEWNYAAAGGNEQREYPWSNPPSSLTLDLSYASYLTTDCLGDGLAGCTLTDLMVVGSKSPKGDGRWGQSDLAGNVWEWNVDWYASPYAMPCDNCSNYTMATNHILRGGTFGSDPQYLLSSTRSNNTSSNYYVGGARCARVP